MKILIVTQFFPPANSIASHRPYSWAKYWSRDGHDVTVVTIPKKYSASESSMPFDGFKYIEVTPPLMRILSPGVRVEENAIKETEICNKRKLTLTQRLKIEFRSWRQNVQSRYGIFYSCRMPDVLDFFWSKSVLKTLGDQSWDLVVSTAGPYGVHAPAYALKKSGCAKYWIADWRDLWVDNHMYPGLPGFRSIERFLERRWCTAADAVTTVSEPLADTLRQKYDDKVHVIYNGFSPEDAEALPVVRAFPDDGMIRILYAGSIYAGHQDPTPLFKAVAELHCEGLLLPSQLQILFCGVNSNVTDLAASEQVSEYVQYLGFLPREKSLHMQRDASVLLLLEFESKMIKGILTGKLFEYLFAGPKIWAVGVEEDSAIAKILKKTDRGIAFGKDDKLLKFQILKAVYLGNNIKEKKTKSLDFYTRSHQSKKLLAIITYDKKQ